MPSGTERDADSRIEGIVVQSGDKTRDDRAAEEEEKRDLTLAQGDPHTHTHKSVYYVNLP